MKANAKQDRAQASESVLTIEEAGRMAVESDFDFSLLDDSLRKTPWERMQANDAALRFAKTLHAAMKKRHGEP